MFSLPLIFKNESFFIRKVGIMKTEKSKEIFWSIISILVGGVAWLTMQNISWGVVDPAKVGFVFAVIGLISLIWALFNKNSDSSRAYETIRNANRSKED